VSRIGNKVVAFESFGRVNVTSFPSMFILISEENSRVNSPLGPLTVMKTIHGTTRANFNNMVVGVSEGFQKALELIGVGLLVLSFRQDENNQRLKLICCLVLGHGIRPR
jgi:ribosomal protein L6P/L9E